MASLEVLMRNVAADWCRTVKVETSINRSLNVRILCVHFVQITHIFTKVSSVKRKSTLRKCTYDTTILIHVYYLSFSNIFQNYYIPFTSCHLHFCIFTLMSFTFELLSCYLLSKSLTFLHSKILYVLTVLLVLHVMLLIFSLKSYLHITK